MARTKNFVDVINKEMAADPGVAKLVEEVRVSADVATKVYEARKAAGLSQKKLAELAETTQSVISRIEDADYDGHTLKLLRRIAKALGGRLEIEFYGCRTVSSAEVDTFEPGW